VRKDERYAGLSVSRRTPNLITSTENGLMRFKRKVHAQFLGGQNLEVLQDRVLDHVGVFVDVLDSARGDDDDDGAKPGRVDMEWSGPVNLARATNWLTLDIITDLVLGVRSELLTDARNRWFANAIATMSWRGALVCGPFRRPHSSQSRSTLLMRYCSTPSNPISTIGDSSTSCSLSLSQLIKAWAI
jgi:hypothetical protein